MHGDPQDKTTAGLWGRAACTWAVAFAVLHFYWALGGGWGLSVSAGPLAEERPGWFVAVGLWGVGMLCMVGGVLGRLLARPRPRGPVGLTVKALGWGACAVLLVRGVAVEVLLLTDTADQGIDVIPEQRMWTLLLWNPWFLIGGLAFGLASRGDSERRRAQVASLDGGSRTAGGGSEVAAWRMAWTLLLIALNVKADDELEASRWMLHAQGHEVAQCTRSVAVEPLDLLDQPATAETSPLSA